MIEFLNSELFAQAVGLIASAFLILSYLVKSDQKLKLLMCISFSIFSLHYFLLHAFVGMFVNIMDVLRISSSMTKKKIIFVMYGFIFSYIAIGAFKYEIFIDIFPVLASVLGTISMYKLSGIRFRLVLFIISCLWLTYGIFVLSIGAIVTNIFLLFANSVTVYRLYRDEKVTLN